MHIKFFPVVRSS